MLNNKQLDTKLGSYEAPAPSDLLKARILKVAGETSAPQRSFAKRYMSIAASLVAVCAIGFATLQVTGDVSEQPETEIWQEAALHLGFSDVYEWVETSDETAAP